MRLLNKVAIQLVKGYKLFVSPFLGARCKYIPSCSQYACDCFGNYGFLKSLGLVTWRVLRCNPLSHGGYDPAVKQTSD